MWVLPAFLGLVLVILTLWLYLPVRSYEFLNYDDPDYVSQNPHVQAGLHWETVKWAFTHSYAFNWHPVTWISHMLDCQFFGPNAGAHHLVNVAFHVANTLLLFLLLRKMTKAVWPSAFVAAFFAFHPLHVESVAWVCERKDVLSTFFWLLTTWAYVSYVHRKGEGKQSRGIVWYGIALLCFALGLMSKAMLVTLPFTLLLLDFWPLSRFSPDDTTQSRPSRLVLEKAPFFLLAIGSSVVTFFVQRTEGAVANTQTFPVGLRIANTFISYLRYLENTIWPKGLMIFYSYPLTWPAWQVTTAVVILLAISAIVIWKVRQLPFLFVGWFWFVGTLVPVIGLVQVGIQSLADRYMYVPLIGLGMMIAWGLWKLATTLRRGGQVVAIGIFVLINAACFFGTRQQLRYWQNSITVFEHAADVLPGNVMAHVMAGNAYNDREDADRAIFHYTEALRVSPNFAEVYYNLGNLLVGKKQFDDAVQCYQKALQLKPGYVDAHANLAYALSAQHKTAEALAQEEAALKLRPGDPTLLRNMAVDLIELKRFDDAERVLTQALQVQPEDAIFNKLLGDLFMAKGNFKEAVPRYRRALELQPTLTEAQQRLDYVLRRLSEVKKGN
ncbi:MAG: Tetratricopeptide 2 repeat protein [Verrucomicrobiales bacterium]|nr:Tetratricopeptide 2 repeat protein [Verrucomicrobiales bacterium]